MMTRRWYRVFNKERKTLDDSLYIEERMSKNGVLYYMQVDDFTVIGEGISAHRIRKSSAENAINLGLWKEVGNGWTLI